MNVFQFLILQQDCLTNKNLVDIEYYHRAILLKENCKPLHGLNIVFSAYTSPERDYLYGLALALGGVVNEVYLKSQNSILICPTPDGENYKKAIEWSKFYLILSDTFNVTQDD